MKINVYVTSVWDNQKPLFVFTANDGAVPKNWAFAYSFEHVQLVDDDKLKSLHEEHQKTIITPEQEIAELKAKLAEYEDVKGE